MSSIVLIFHRPSSLAREVWVVVLWEEGLRKIVNLRGGELGFQYRNLTNAYNEIGLIKGLCGFSRVF